MDHLSGWPQHLITLLLNAPRILERIYFRPLLLASTQQICSPVRRVSSLTNLSPIDITDSSPETSPEKKRLCFQDENACVDSGLSAEANFDLKDPDSLPLLQKEPLRICDRAAQIMAFDADSLGDKICEKVPQICPGKTATYFVDLSKLGHPDDIGRDSYGSWGRFGTENHCYAIDNQSKSVRKVNTGRMEEGPKIDMKIRRRFCKHPQTNGQLRKSIFTAYFGENLNVPKLAIVSYEWLCTPFDFINKAHGNCKDQTKPFQPTAKSVINRMREKAQYLTPQQNIHSMTEEVGTVVQSSPAFVPRSKKQARAIAATIPERKKGKGGSSVRTDFDRVSTMVFEQNSFIIAFEPGESLGSVRALLGSKQNFHLFRKAVLEGGCIIFVDMTYHPCEKGYLTIISVRHPLLIDAETGRNVLRSVAFSLSTQRKTEDYNWMAKTHSHRRLGSWSSTSSSIDEFHTPELVLSPSAEYPLHESPSFSGTLTLLEDDRLTPSTSEPKVVNPIEGDLGEPSKSAFFLPRHSKLPRNVKETLNDSSALPYFKEYLASISQVHLVKFWLEAQSFRVSARSSLNSIAAEKVPPDSSDGDNSICGSIGGDSGVADCNSKSPPSKGGLIKMFEQDAISIFTKYISKDSRYCIQLPSEVQNSVIKRICSENGHLDPDCFVAAQQIVLGYFENRYFPEFLGSVHYCKLQIDVLTSQNISLADIIFNESTLSIFTEFLDQEGQRRLIEFWLAVESFSQDLLKRQGMYSGLQAQEDAMVLYVRYISMQATQPLGIDEKLRIETENNICREGGPLPNCFENVQRMVFAYMEKCYLLPFKTSPLFHRYLSELWHTIETTIELPNPSKPRFRSGSGSSGGLSFSSAQSDPTLLLRRPNPLLVQETTRRTSLMSRDPFMDSLLGNESPDDLWKRKPVDDKFTLASIDNFGRYHSNFGTPRLRPRNAGNKLKNSINTIIGKNTQEEETIADQLAALIVNDITKMTNNLENSSL